MGTSGSALLFRWSSLGQTVVVVKIARDSFRTYQQDAAALHCGNIQPDFRNNHEIVMTMQLAGPLVDILTRERNELLKATLACSMALFKPSSMHVD